MANTLCLMRVYHKVYPVISRRFFFLTTRTFFPLSFYNASHFSSVSGIYTSIKNNESTCIYTMANEESISVHFSSIDYLHKKRRPHDLARRIGEKLQHLLRDNSSSMTRYFCRVFKRILNRVSFYIIQWNRRMVIPI